MRGAGVDVRASSGGALSGAPQVLHSLAGLLALALAVLAPALARPAPIALEPTRSDAAPPERAEPSADSRLDLPFSTSSLALAVGGERLRRSGGDPFTTGSFAIRGSTTLFSRLRVDPAGSAGITAWGLVAQADARGFATDLAEVEGSGTFLRLGASLGAYYAPSRRSVYWLQAGAFLAEQAAILTDSPRLRPHVLALGSYRASEALRLLYGAGYTYAAGRGFPLPFLGAAWRFAPRWHLLALLPVLARVTWTANDRVSLSGVTGLSGDLFRYRARGPSGEELQDLRIARLRLGIAGQYALSRKTFLELEAGAEGASVDTGLSSRSAVGAYSVLSLGYGRSGPFQTGLR